MLGVFVPWLVLLPKRYPMKKLTTIGLVILVLLSACMEEDPGPRQQDKRTFTEVDFDQIEAEDALVVNIEYAENFSIEAEGDRRNLDDLLIYKNGNSLVARFRTYEKRQYTTYLTITLPDLTGVNFSGASQGKIIGFDPAVRFDITLSGASFVQVNRDMEEVYLNVSGASHLRLDGHGELVQGTISGASELSAFDFSTRNAKLTVTGASSSKVNVSNQLDVSVSGASVVLYRGEPELIVESSGSSVVRKD